MPLSIAARTGATRSGVGMPRGRKPHRPPLTIERILAWADAHHARTGRRPSANSGLVVEAPGTTWNAVNLALVLGLRGLPGGSSLTSLLNNHRPLDAQFHRGWTPAEDKLVRTLPPQEVAQQTGRSLEAVYQRRCQLGVTAPTGHRIFRRWTRQEDTWVRTLPAREVAQRTGRSLTSVYVRRRALGLGRR
jgi:hypothetical protein